MGQIASYDSNSDEGRALDALLTVLENAGVEPYVIEECAYCFGNGDEGYEVVRKTADGDDRDISPADNECWADILSALSDAMRLNGALAQQEGCAL